MIDDPIKTPPGEPIEVKHGRRLWRGQELGSGWFSPFRLHPTEVEHDIERHKRLDPEKVVHVILEAATPKLRGGERTKGVLFHLTPAEKAELEAKARSVGMTISEFVRFACYALPV